MRWTLPLTALCVALTAISSAQAQERFRPAQFAGAPTPPPNVSPMVPGGGEVILEVLVDRTVRVTDITALRSTPPFTSEFSAWVRRWTFRPAERLTESQAPREPAKWAPTDSRVLVAEVVRPPTLLGP